MDKIKLSALQKTTLEQIQSQKAQLNKVFQDLNEKEKLVLELIFEGKIPTGKQISNVRLEADQLIYETTEVAPKEVVAPAPKEAKVRKLKKE